MLVRGSLVVLSPRDLDWRHHEVTRGREERKGKGKGKGETRPGGCWLLGVFVVFVFTLYYSFRCF